MMGVRNSVLRGVENIFCVQLTDDGFGARMNGMKEDNRFFSENERESDESDSVSDV